MTNPTSKELSLFLGRYPFGSELVGRSYTVSASRNGFNGQEKDKELGDNGVFTAEYWEYDGKIGRRWNLDPKSKHNISNFSCNSNSPISSFDPNGDDNIIINNKNGGSTKIKAEGEDVFYAITANGMAKAATDCKNYNTTLETKRKKLLSDWKAKQSVKPSDEAIKIQTAIIKMKNKEKKEIDFYLTYAKKVVWDNETIQKTFIEKMEKKTEGTVVEDENSADCKGGDCKTKKIEDDLETGGFVIIDFTTNKASLIEDQTAKRSILAVQLNWKTLDNAHPQVQFVDAQFTKLIIGKWHTHPNLVSNSTPEGPSTGGDLDLPKSKSDINHMNFVFQNKNIYPYQNGIVSPSSVSLDVVKTALTFFGNHN